MRISVYQKERIESEWMGAGRPFKLDVKNRFLMILGALLSVHNIHVSWLSL